MVTTTQRVIDLVQRKLGHPVYSPASNSAVGRVLGLSHTYVKRLNSGDGVLSRDAFVRACKFLELQPEEIVELTLALDADGSEDEGMRAYIRNIAKKLRPNIVKGSASILIGAAAMLAHVDDARASGNLVVSEHDARAASPGELRGFCILWLIACARAIRRLMPGTVSHIPMRPAFA